MARAGLGSTDWTSVSAVLPARARAPSSAAQSSAAGGWRHRRGTPGLRAERARARGRSDLRTSRDRFALRLEHQTNPPSYPLLPEEQRPDSAAVQPRRPEPWISMVPQALPGHATPRAEQLSRDLAAHLVISTALGLISFGNSPEPSTAPVRVGAPHFSAPIDSIVAAALAKSLVERHASAVKPT